MSFFSLLSERETPTENSFVRTPGHLFVQGRLKKNCQKHIQLAPSARHSLLCLPNKPRSSRHNPISKTPPLTDIGSHAVGSGVGGSRYRTKSNSAWMALPLTAHTPFLPHIPQQHNTITITHMPWFHMNVTNCSFVREHIGRHDMELWVRLQPTISTTTGTPTTYNRNANIY